MGVVCPDLELENGPEFASLINFIPETHTPYKMSYMSV